MTRDRIAPTPQPTRPGRTCATGCTPAACAGRPQRRTLIEVLSQTDGHVTGAELVERCREMDPTTIPSTVYRTLDVLEELGLLSHSHGADGREEFHVRPIAAHGHLHCIGCGTTWEIDADEAASLVASLERPRASPST